MSRESEYHAEIPRRGDVTAGELRCIGHIFVSVFISLYAGVAAFIERCEYVALYFKFMSFYLFKACAGRLCT